MRRLVCVFVLSGVAVLSPAVADGQIGPAHTEAAFFGSDPIDVDGDCHDDVPVLPEPPTGTPRPLGIVLAVNDNVPAARGKALAEALRRLYRPAGIDARVTVRRVRLQGTDVRQLIALTKTLFRGGVPAGSDVVHLITAVDLTSQGQKSNVGLAECIGGIRDRRRAFSVSEISETVRNAQIGPVTNSGDEEARTAAHEIGHLLGARHEDSNCVQGAPAQQPTDTPCTIMFFAAPSSDVFGAVEAAKMRGYVRDYAG